MVDNEMGRPDAKAVKTVLRPSKSRITVPKLDAVSNLVCGRSTLYPSGNYSWFNLSPSCVGAI